jgi:hypothetical protein
VDGGQALSPHPQRHLVYEDNCNENNHHIVIGNENYFVSGDGYLMPARKDQAPPDLRYFTLSKPLPTGVP